MRLLMLRRRRLVLLRMMAVTWVLWSKMGTRSVVVHGRRGRVVLLMLVLVMSRPDGDGARRGRDRAWWDEVRLLVVICMRMCMCRRRGSDRARCAGVKGGRPRAHRDRLSTNRVDSCHRGRWDRWRLWGRFWRRRILFLQGSCGQPFACPSFCPKMIATLCSALLCFEEPACARDVALKPC